MAGIDQLHFFLNANQISKSLANYCKRAITSKSATVTALRGEEETKARVFGAQANRSVSQAYRQYRRLCEIKGTKPTDSGVFRHQLLYKGKIFNKTDN